MKAVILVGGEGTRLRPLTCNIPKPMVPVLNKPFLERMIRNIARYGVSDVILAMRYLPDRIQAYFDRLTDLGVNIDYVVEDSPLGTSGAVKNVQRRLDDTFLVFNGDVFMDLDISRMLAHHKQHGAKATIALIPVENPSAYGVVVLDPTGRAQRFIEKPPKGTEPSNLINAGCYILEPEVLDYVPAGKPSMFERDLFPTILAKGLPVYGMPSSGYWLDIGNPAAYMKLNFDLLKGGLVQESRCSVHPTAVITGPVLLGPGCTVGARARIDGPVAMGPGCSIGEDSRLSRSVLWSNVNVGVGSSLFGSILCNNASIGDRVALAEGCIVADGASVLSGNNLGAGVSLWPNTTVFPNTVTLSA